MTIFFLKSENFRSPKNSNNSNKSKIINNEISLVQWKQNKFKFKFRSLRHYVHGIHRLIFNDDFDF